MITYDANGAMLTAHVLDRAIDDFLHERVIHAWQIPKKIEIVAVSPSHFTLLPNVRLFFDRLLGLLMTYREIPLRWNPEMRRDQVVLELKDVGPFARIVNLAVPLG